VVLVTLYADDGRALANVYVALPMPPALAWAGETYLWSRVRRRYERYAAPVPCLDPPAGTFTAPPGAKAEPEEF
jgi:hypothetical protein